MFKTTTPPAHPSSLFYQFSVFVNSSHFIYLQVLIFPLLLFIIPFPISQEEGSPHPQLFLPFFPFSFRREVSFCPGWAVQLSASSLIPLLVEFTDATFHSLLNTVDPPLEPNILLESPNPLNISYIYTLPTPKKGAQSHHHSNMMILRELTKSPTLLTLSSHKGCMPCPALALKKKATLAHPVIFSTVLPQKPSDSQFQGKVYLKSNYFGRPKVLTVFFKKKSFSPKKTGREYYFLTKKIATTTKNIR